MIWSAATLTGSRMGLYLWQESEAGINPGLPGKDEPQYWWIRWWAHCLPHKDFLWYYQNPSFLAKPLLYQQPNPSLVLVKPKETKRDTVWWSKDPEKIQLYTEQWWPNFKKSVLHRIKFDCCFVFYRVFSTNGRVEFWHRWLCCQTEEHNSRSHLIVNSKNKSIVLLQLRLLHF